MGTMKHYLRKASHVLPLSRQEQCVVIAARMACMANPYRLEILLTLCQEERTVTHICQSMKKPQSAVSAALTILRLRKLVKTRRQGRHIYYRLVEDLREALMAVFVLTEKLY